MSIANVGSLDVAYVSWWIDQSGKMTDYGVRLDYSQRNADRVGDIEQLSCGNGPTWLSFKPYEPGITVGYIRSLAREGYVGLQRIPRWAVKR